MILRGEGIETIVPTLGTLRLLRKPFSDVLPSVFLSPSLLLLTLESVDANEYPT